MKKLIQEQKSFNMATAIPATKLKKTLESDKENKICKLCIKGVPEYMTPLELKKILGQYGNVFVKELAPGSNKKFPYRFAECPNRQEMLSIINGMKNDKSGYVVEEKKNSSSALNSSTEPVEYENKSDSSNKTSNEKISRSSQQSKGNMNRKISDSFLKNRIRQNQNFEKIEKLSEKPTVNGLPKYKPYDMNDVKIFHCFLCGKVASMCCSRCEEIYCSVECQDKDWLKHKHVCFKKPKLVNISSLAKIDGCVEGASVSEKSFVETKTSQITAATQGHRKSAINDNSAIEENIVKQPKEQKTENKDIAGKRFITNLIGTDKIKRNSNEMEKQNASESQPHVPKKKIIKSPLPTSGQQVVMTHFDQLNQVYIRSNEKLENDKYVETITFVNEFAKDTKYLTEMPKPNDMVVCNFEGDWYRALVLSPENENKILIAYIDFGNAEVRKLSELKHMHPEFFNFQRYPICVSLKGIPEIALKDVNSECINYMKGLVDNYVHLKIKYIDNEKNGKFQFVDLFEHQTNLSVNEKIQNLLTKEVKTDRKSVFLKDLKYIKFPSCEDKELIILDNSFIEAGFITCVLSDNIDHIEKNVETFTEYALKDSNPYEPLESELCMVKVKENPPTWYRASCESILENGRLELLLVDFGSICDESISNVRKYPVDLNIPCYSSICFLKDLSEAVNQGQIDNEVKSKLTDLLPSFSYIEVPKLEVIEQDVFIDLPEKIRAEIKKNLCY